MSKSSEDLKVKLPLTVTLITYNEEQKIGAALKSVDFAREVIVVDSGSTDRTCEIARSFGATVVNQPWLGYGQQKNFAHQRATQKWILNLDADERVSEELRTEIQTLFSSGEPKHAGYLIPRKTLYLGRWIQHGGWYPNFLVRLAPKEGTRWTEPPVHESWEVRGELARLNGAFIHESFDSISGQVLTNLRFAELGSKALRQRGKRGSIFLCVLKPIGKFLETYLWKRGFRDGIPGFLISVNAAYSIFLKYALLLEEQIRVNPSPQKQRPEPFGEN